MENIKYIKYDDSELLFSDFDDKTLNLIAELMGPDIRDKLLVPVVDDVLRPSSRNHKHVI